MPLTTYTEIHDKNFVCSNGTNHFLLKTIITFHSAACCYSRYCKKIIYGLKAFMLLLCTQTSICATRRISLEMRMDKFIVFKKVTILTVIFLLLY